MKLLCVLLVSVLCSSLSWSDPPPPGTGDWPMLGGRPDRNMVSDATNLPTKWKEKGDPQIRWTAALGTITYGNPVVSGGRVYVGTNNGQPRDASIEGDRGVLMCFAEADGKFLWQAVHDKLETGNAEDWAEIGICSTPCVVGDRVYYVNNRAELVCCDAQGFADGENDGPHTGEKRSGKADADYVWFLDMRQLGVTPFQASASSPLVVGDLVFTVTGHGVDERTHLIKNAKAPSFLAANRNTGKIVWQSASPGDRIIEGQWGSPAYGVVGGVAQVVFPGGDGWLYAFEPATGKLLWQFDCKAHEQKDKRTQNQIVATPVVAGDRVLIAIGPNPEAGGGPGALCAIDATKRGDITKSGEAWRLHGEAFGASISTVAVHDGLIYAVELDGFIGCIDLKTGKRVWRHDLLSTVWGSPLVADGKIYVRTEDGDVVVLKTGREAKVLSTNALPGLSHGTVVAKDGVLFIAGSDKLYAVASAATKAAAPTPAPAETPRAVGVATSGPASSAADWTGWRGANRDAKVTFDVPAEWPKELTKGWSVEVGTGHATPALVGDRLYVHARQDDQEVALCLDANSGKEIWRDSYPVLYKMDPTATEHGKGPKSSVSVVDGRMVTFGITGVMSCYDAKTGKRAWRRDFLEEFKVSCPQYGVAMSPLVLDGLVYAHIGGDKKGAMVGLDVATGETKWSWDGDGPGYSSPIVRTVGGKKQLITQTQFNAVGLSPADGALLWKLEYKTNYDQNSVSPVVYGDTVIMSGFQLGTTAHKIDGDEPKEVWDTSRVSMYMSTPIVKGALVYGFSQKRRGQFFCLDAKTGDALWRGDGRQGENAALVDAGDVILGLNTDSELIAFKATDEDYEELARYTVADTPTWAHPVVSGKRVFVKAEKTLTEWKLP